MIDMGSLIRDIRSHPLALGFIALTILIKTVWLMSIPNQSTLMENDSVRYLSISENFIATFFGDTPNFDSFFITPGYPLFLSAFHADNLKLIIFFQFLLLAASQFILFRLILSYTSDKIAYLGLFLYLLESASTLESFNLLTETLFNFVFILFLYFFGIGKDKKTTWYASGFVLGVALIVRPVGQILLIPLILMIVFKAWRKQASVVLLIAILISSTWIVRNQVVFGVPQLSGIQSLNLLYFEGAGAFAKANDVTLKEAQGKELELETTEIGVNSSIKALVDYRVDRGIDLILVNLIGFAELHLDGAVKILIGPGSANIDKLTSHFSISENVINSLKAMIILLRFFIIFLAGLCIFHAIKRRNFIPIQFYSIVAWILVLISSGGANAYSRFRVPLIPLETIIICIGLSSSSPLTWFNRSITRVKETLKMK